MGSGISSWKHLAERVLVAACVVGFRACRAYRRLGRLGATAWASGFAIWVSGQLKAWGCCCPGLRVIAECIWSQGQQPHSPPNLGCEE